MFEGVDSGFIFLSQPERIDVCGAAMVEAGSELKQRANVTSHNGE